MKKDPRLGRHISPPDKDDWDLENYAPRTLSIFSPRITEKVWAFNSLPTDQANTGHCGGFAGVDWMIAEPTPRTYTNVLEANKDGHDLYYQCVFIDGKPGSEDGTCERSVMKALKAAGRIGGYAVTSAWMIIDYWLKNKSSMIASTIWTEGMFYPDKNGIIHPVGAFDIMSGHIYVLLGVQNINNVPHVVGQSSWGIWGLNGTGRFFMPVSEYKWVLRSYGEVSASVEKPYQEVAA